MKWIGEFCLVVMCRGVPVWVGEMSGVVWCSVIRGGVGVMRACEVEGDVDILCGR